MVVFDSSVLLLLIHPNAKPPNDPSTGKPLEHAKQRIEYLIKTLSESNTRILIPTPTLSEILVRTGQATSEYLNLLNNTYRFKIANFDQRAAIEVALFTDQQSKKKKLSEAETYAKLKYDRQIVAIAKVNGADRIYSNDGGIHTLAKLQGIAVTRIEELDIPPEERQRELTLPEPNDEKK